MRFSKHSLIVAALALGAVGCSTSDGGPTTSTVPPLAYVRFINAVPDTLNATVRWVDYLEFTPQTFVNVAYRGVGQGLYQGMKAGSRHFRIFTSDAVDYTTAGNTVVLADVTQDFTAGNYYTIILSGYARAGSTPAKSVKIIQDNLPAPGSNVALRVYNPALGQGAVDFHIVPTTSSALNATPDYSAVAEGTFSAYKTMAPAAFAIRTANGGTTNILSSAAAPAGAAGTTAVDPIAGATVGGSVLTAFYYPPSVAGSKAASVTSSTVVFVADKQPPRTTSP